MHAVPVYDPPKSLELVVHPETVVPGGVMVYVQHSDDPESANDTFVTMTHVWPVELVSNVPT